MFAVIGILVLFVAVKLEISPCPDANNPILILSLVQLNTVPATPDPPAIVLVKAIAFTASPSHKV